MAVGLSLIDTHTHLYLPEFDEDGRGHGAVQRALDAGIKKMIFPNVDLTTVEPMRSLASEFPRIVYMAMGLHPTEVNESWIEDTAKVMSMLGDGRDYVAIGEVGIDLYWDRTYMEQQMLSFAEQLKHASALNLPVIIHCREGLEQTLEVLSDFPGVKAVFHSFGGTIDDVERIRKVGDYYFGINGIVTFKNCRVRDTLGEIGLDRILLETDAPYLAPVPHRGKRNESAFMVHTAAHIAAHMDLPLAEIAARTNANAHRLFPKLLLNTK